MKNIVPAVWAECLKCYRSKILWITILAFIFVPCMMGVLMFVVKNPEFASKLGSSDVKVWTYGTSQRTHDSITDDIGTPNDPVTALIMSFMESTLGH